MLVLGPSKTDSMMTGKPADQQVVQVVNERFQLLQPQRGQLHVRNLDFPQPIQRRAVIATFQCSRRKPDPLRCLVRIQHNQGPNPGFCPHHDLPPEFNVVKFRTDELKLSFLSYPEVLDDAHPALRHAVTIDLVSGRVRHTD